MLKDVKQDLAVHKTETGRQRVGDHIFNVEDKIFFFFLFYKKKCKCLPYIE